MTLAELNLGDRFKLIKVNTGGEVGKRLADMGFVAGVEGRLLRKAHIGDPIEVTLLDYHLSIRRSEAETLSVNKI